MKGTVVLASAALVLAACAEASGEVRGGELAFDPTPPAFVEPNACPVEDEADAGTGTTWTDLYRDYFGPTGRAKCADPSCHGGEGTPASSIGFRCFDQSGCRASLVDRWIVLPADAAEPEKSAFYRVLRRCNEQNETVGTMPQRPTYYFSGASLARISTWMQGGAKDD